jgi:hypothetical protein
LAARAISALALLADQLREAVVVIGVQLAEHAERARRVLERLGALGHQLGAVLTAAEREPRVDRTVGGQAGVQVEHVEARVDPAHRL